MRQNAPGPLLEIRNLSLSVDTDEGQARILDSANLALMPGSIHGVVGESGCGKSTLMRAVLGILPKRGRVTEGKIVLGGRDLLSLSPAILQREVRGGQIGFIPQDPYQAFNPVFRVGTQLLETFRARPRADRRDGGRANIISLLKAVQLPDPEGALDRYPHQFSGGQRQRLLIAAALASSPAIILADEPTTALDVTTQLQILKLLRGLAEERGLSMLFVTHDFGVVAQLCDTVTVMYAGQTVESGPVSQILATPLHPYTRMLLACHPDRGAALAGIPGSVSSPLRPPSGCRFHPRCPSAKGECSKVIPRRTEQAENQDVQCVLYGAEAAA
ncbi:ABC transporter ATP-binding protein [Bradyrhizobium sp. Leo121]|uniref:ABC transporter ATP-binding protein n=1 Tax=Bradyrhizobium sp. Leo121 TaxID=1571195 RepID=UPI00102A4974|nr:ABC transporter ATP-binding protein [Bradyrhizobium sp. Leo121]RZN34487.1 methionine ABC transporter ATP-binding protein [Bradyrhizobium sp. Leo121]